MFDVNRRYGILGLARSGIAAAYKIKEFGGHAFLSELHPRDKIEGTEELCGDFECEFGGHSERLFECDEWIVSPGIPLNIPIIKQGCERGIHMISELEFGYQIKDPGSKIIAVTGSNGKSTTASLIYHILKGMGYKTLLAGNIGDAFCGFPIHQPGYDFIVLEVSSFQLDLIDTFKPDVAVLLNITPDHMNRYETFEHYRKSKFRIFENQTEDDFAVINIDSPPIMNNIHAINSPILRFSMDKKAPDTDAWIDGVFIYLNKKQRLSIHDLSIKGPHNHANTMASLLSVTALTDNVPLVLDSVVGFAPLTHRLEYVATIAGVSFYNDSKATNSDSVKSALMSFGRPIRVVMGGSDKGEDFSVLTEMLKTWALKVYITGETEAKMRQAWLGKIPLVCINDFEKCIKTAFEESLAGDIIVLSPACASFDKFRNFEHRGETFTDIVHKIAMENEKK
ncbi:MAG: UDP-N-acetylmuramoyl-L-alanine--D-glutamate ligase [Candidatus Cloacimonadaceae bacterium]|nr:UDP-N-acetylmuramoyl-L-alanine--D-glutamate ligase [Candidatus Cloacimonadaceae bacterium]